VAAVGVGAVLTALPASAAAKATRGFGFDDVVVKARALAQKPYQEPPKNVPDWLQKIDYDQWRKIRYRPEDALWHDTQSPFQVQFFHPGLFYDRTVDINVVNAQGVRPVAFSPNVFDYGGNDFASRVPQKLGWAGFRVHARIKTRKYFDEVIVFLGATYFRAVGRDNVFGLSARGLAIDTALSKGEEFPWFREFWLERPRPNAKEMTIWALLDSQSVTGAYQFVVFPGAATIVKVSTQLFFRKEVGKLGVAPLTSMFFHGENSTRSVEDFRPEVHDSDGLLMSLASGEWLWRPLQNPATLRVNSFMAENVRGFGLIQRDRDFDHYQDLETHAELRPSVWQTPDGDWGPGHVELVEIPTKTDTNDNIVTFWVPEKKPKAGDELAFAYAQSWSSDGNRPPAGRVVATRRDRGNKDDAYRFVVDFTGKKLNALPADTVVRGVVTVASGKDSAELLDQHVVKNDVTGGWRLTFQVRPKQNDPILLRAFLDQGDETLTETWTYELVP
jgi:glucans biosynthesis protein